MDGRCEGFRRAVHGRLAEVNEILDRAAHDEALTSSEVKKARDSLGASAMHLGGLGMQGNLPGAMLQASPFLEQFGCVALAVEAVEQARVALDRQAAGGMSDDAARRYRGKVLNLRFYVAHILRAIATDVPSAPATSCMDEALFC